MISRWFTVWGEIWWRRDFLNFPLLKSVASCRGDRSTSSDTLLQKYMAVRVFAPSSWKHGWCPQRTDNTHTHTHTHTRPAHLRLGATGAPRWQRRGIRRTGIAGDLWRVLPRLSELCVNRKKKKINKKTHAQMDVRGMRGGLSESHILQQC